MKLTSVELHPKNSENVVVLSFKDPRRLERYNVRDISGLDADEIIARYYGTSSEDGKVKFYSFALEKREPIFRIELNPRFGQDESYSDLRDDFYKMIASSRTGLIEIQFKNGNVVVATISGFVSKFESPNFTKTPEILLTVKCKEPMLKAPEPVEMNVLNLDPAATMINDPQSTSPHGFKFELGFVNDLASLVLTDPFDASWRFEVMPAGGFLAGDVLHFSSELNDKHLYVVRGGVTIHLANVITPSSVWPILFPGENTFSFENDASVVWEAISYYPTYWGV